MSSGLRRGFPSFPKWLEGSVPKSVFQNFFGLGDVFVQGVFAFDLEGVFVVVATALALDAKGLEDVLAAGV